MSDEDNSAELIPSRSGFRLGGRFKNILRELDVVVILAVLLAAAACLRGKYFLQSLKPVCRA